MFDVKHQMVDTGDMELSEENESEPESPFIGKKQVFGKSSKNIYCNIYKDSTKRYPGIWFLLLRWKGSVYKLLWVDFVIFIVLYTIISLMYRVILFHNPRHRQMFELLCVFAGRFSNSLPITFLIGLYVTHVVERWWSQFLALPSPDQLAMKLTAFIPGKVSLHYFYNNSVMQHVHLNEHTSKNNETGSNYHASMGNVILHPS